MKNILNEINEIKYLFGYKPGRVISEQNVPVAGLKDVVDLYYQFDSNYFKENPTGTITMRKDNTFPIIEKINNMTLNDNVNFNNHWQANGTDFGRGFDSGNGAFNYSWDGTQLNIVGGSGNENNCRPEGCFYVKK